MFSGMKSFGLMACLNLLSEVSAAPSPASIVANFDGLKGSALLPPVMPSTYDSLSWSGFAIASAGQLSIDALEPSSLPNFAVGPILQSGFATPTITSNFTGSTVSGFNLNSLSAGCTIASQNNIVAPPVNCTIQVTGSKAGVTIMTTNLSFVVKASGGISFFGFSLPGFGSGLGSSSTTVQSFSSFSGFKSVDTVQFTITNAAVPVIKAGLTVQLAVDDVNLSLISK